jgi:hypothetical protein
MRDFRPDDDQKDSIVNQTRDWLNDVGFEELAYKTQYFETRPIRELSRELAPGIGTTRVSWIYVPCGPMTVMAQQMQKGNDKHHRGEYTFRKWNPNHEDALWESDNSAELGPCCPGFLFIWYFIEILFFKLNFNETIDHCVGGNQEAYEIINEYRYNNSIMCQTMMVRLLCYFLNLGGFYMLCAPLVKLMGVLPLAAFFLENAFYVAALCTAAVVTLAAQLFFTSLAWMAYRPLLATFLLLISFTVGGLFMLPQGDGLSYHDVNDLYAKRAWY